MHPRLFWGAFVRGTAAVQYAWHYVCSAGASCLLAMFQCHQTAVCASLRVVMVAMRCAGLIICAGRGEGVLVDAHSGQGLYTVCVSVLVDGVLLLLRMSFALNQSMWRDGSAKALAAASCCGRRSMAHGWCGDLPAALFMGWE